MKMWRSWGAPTLEQWFKICCNLDSIDRMKENVCAGLNNASIETGFRFVLLTSILGVVPLISIHRVWPNAKRPTGKRALVPGPCCIHI